MPRSRKLRLDRAHPRQEVRGRVLVPGYPLPRHGPHRPQAVDPQPRRRRDILYPRQRERQQLRQLRLAERVRGTGLRPPQSRHNYAFGTRLAGPRRRGGLFDGEFTLEGAKGEITRDNFLHVNIDQGTLGRRHSR